eukprot:COSAG01_NODE_57519_length_311_cov_22.061321_1_plen_44_part_01
MRTETTAAVAAAAASSGCMDESKSSLWFAALMERCAWPGSGIGQ